MQDLWHALEERSRAWDALSRQGLADAVWEDYVTFRFGRTGDPGVLAYLYPYLNHANRRVRETAMAVAGSVLEGRAYSLQTLSGRSEGHQTCVLPT